jgi:hypothetical protein
MSKIEDMEEIAESNEVEESEDSEDSEEEVEFTADTGKRLRKVRVSDDGSKDPPKTRAPKVKSIVNQWEKTGKNGKDLKGWTLDLYRCIDSISTPTFSGSDVYKFQDQLQKQHPKNNNIVPKIRQQLYYLAKLGYVKRNAAGNPSNGNEPKPPPVRSPPKTAASRAPPTTFKKAKTSSSEEIIEVPVQEVQVVQQKVEVQEVQVQQKVQEKSKQFDPITEMLQDFNDDELFNLISTFDEPIF